MFKPIRRLPKLLVLACALLFLNALSISTSAASPAVGAPLTINVKTDAGAIGDGVADDTVAFKNALGRLNSAGGTLFIPAGTYRVSSTLTIKSNITVMGDHATITTTQIGYQLLYLAGANIALSGITVDGANRILIGVDVGPASSNLLIADATIQNITQPSDPAHPLYYGLPIGLHIDGGGSGITVDRVTVKNIVARNITGPAWPHKVARGILINTSGSTTISKNIVIRNSTFSDVGPMDDGDCIVIQDSTDLANLAILNNSFDRCHKRAIKLQVPGVVVANNRINNPFLGDNKLETWPTAANPENNRYDVYAAISIYASNIVVTGNTISGVGSFYNAIETTGIQRNITIQTNSIAMGASANLSTPSSLIRVFQSIDNLVITDNLLDYGAFGIYINAALSNPQIARNTITHTLYPIRCSVTC